MARVIELTPLQAKFYKAVMKVVAEDKELLEFCCTPLSGKTTVLELLDRKFDFMSKHPETNKDY